MALPLEVEEIALALDLASRQAREVVDGLDDARANWQPGGGRSWSVAQCLDHLARANEAYVPPLQAALRAARERGRLRRGPVAPGWLGGWLARELDPPPRRKAGAPRSIVPASSIPRDEALSRFLRSQDAVRRLLDEGASLDLSVRFANPFVPLLRFRVADGFRIVVTHDRRHLWQARRVREDPLFPA